MTFMQAHYWTETVDMAEESHNPFDMGGSAAAPDVVSEPAPGDAAGGALDANLFATPAADSYNPAGTGANAPNDECMLYFLVFMPCLTCSDA